MKKDLFDRYERKEKSRFRYGAAAGKDPTTGFQCAACHAFISTEPGLSGVQNRNHCPFCLWSRHLDLYAAGDRLSACKSLMKPIGLTFKHTHKKYGPRRGELMLVHECMECGAFSINRIAADDDPQKVFAVFKDSIRLGNLPHAKLSASKISVLEAVDMETVQVQLFGWEIGLAAALFQC